MPLTRGPFHISRRRLRRSSTASGAFEVIENETLSIPGSVDTYQLRAESSHGPFSGPMLSLISGNYPTSPGEVALTEGVASAFNVRIGQLWSEGGTQRRVVGVVEDPLDTLDYFALVVPGQVRTPSEIDLLFDAPGVEPSTIGPNVAEVGSVAIGAANPETIILVVAVIGMLLVTLVAAGGFTVLAQRRLRSLGMLSSIGATEKQVRAVVRTNGAVVGIVGTLLGALLGFIAWLVYRPALETSSFHVIGTFALPWVVIGPAMGLAVVASYVAARRPARTVAKVPIVAALSGRPVEPKRVHRSAVGGVVLLVVSFVLLGYSTTANRAKPQIPFLVGGLVALIPGVILLAPFFLSLAARIGRHAPIATRLALRDLARYRARSGSSLAAISIAVLITVIVAVAAAARYGNVLDYAGPNLASNQVVVYAPLPGRHAVVRPERVEHRSEATADGSDQSACPRDRRSARGEFGDSARAGKRQPEPRGVRTELERPHLRGDTPTVEGVRHHVVGDRSERPHPHHATWSIGRLEYAVHVVAAAKARVCPGCFEQFESQSLSEELVSLEPED